MNDKFMDGAIVSVLRSTKEFSEAYYKLKEKAREYNCFIDGLDIYKIVEEEPIYAHEIDTDYVKINRDYALILETAGDCKAYIKALYYEEN